MSSLVSFGTSNPFGAALRLIYNARHYTEEGIRDSADQLQYEYTCATGRNPEHKEHFYSLISQKKDLKPIDIVSSPFFQSMLASSPPSYHDHVVAYIVPEMVKKYAGEIGPLSDADKGHEEFIRDSLARFIVTFISKQEIMRSYTFQGGILPDVALERDRISKDLIRNAKEKWLNEEDITYLTLTLRTVVDAMAVRPVYYYEKLKFAGWYLSLLAMDPDAYQSIVDSIGKHDVKPAANAGTPSPFGSAVRLIYNASKYSPQGLKAEGDQLEHRYIGRVNHVPDDKDEFYEFVRVTNKLEGTVRPVDVVSTEFFKSLISRKAPVYEHDAVVNYVLPEALKGYTEIITDQIEGSALVKDWLANFLEAIHTNNQIERSCRFHGCYFSHTNVVCTKINKNLNDSIQASKLTQQDVTLIKRAVVSAYDLLKLRRDHLSEKLKFAGWYLTLFAMGLESSRALAENVITNLPELKTKLFSRSTSLPSLPEVRAVAPPMGQEEEKLYYAKL